MSQQQVIVSLTSFPPAITYAARAVQSILNGSILPDKVILYLTFAEFGEKGIPQDLQELTKKNSRFEIRDYPINIRSYRKLVPALTDFPDAIIVTVDDDVNYHPNMLRDLLELHKQIPNAVLAHRAKCIKPDKPYSKWKKYRWYHFLRKRIHTSFRNIPPMLQRHAVITIISIAFRCLVMISPPKKSIVNLGMHMLKLKLKPGLQIPLQIRL